MVRNTRSQTSKAVSGANNADKTRHGRLERSQTPEGLPRTLREEESESERDRRSAGGRNSRAEEIVREEPQAAQPDAGLVLKEFLETREAAELFTRFMDQREEEAEASSRHGPPRRNAAPLGSRTRGNHEADLVREGRRDLNHQDRDRRDLGRQERDFGHRDRRAFGSQDRASPRHHLTGGVFGAYGKIVTPFSDEILNTRLPEKYRVPNITPYDGLRDPQNFLFQFQYNMINQCLNYVHMCKLFPELLVDNARQWFDSLPPGSIGSYEDLMEAFQRRFFQKAEYKVTSAHLLNIRQGRGESISDFMTRFNQESLRVQDTNDLLVISAFQNGILPGALYKEIVREEPRTTTELWRIADRFAKADEADRRKREVERGETSEKKKKDEGRGDQNRSRKSAFDRIQRGSLESRLGPRGNSDPPRQQYTPLTKSRTKIFELHTDLFERPRPMTGGSKRRSKDKYCSFHEDYGHDTEECRNLMADIEDLVQEGTLKKYQGKGRRAAQDEVPH